MTACFIQGVVKEYDKTMKQIEQNLRNLIQLVKLNEKD